jgi:hypothetical protein
MRKFKCFVVPEEIKRDFRKIWGKLYSSIEKAKIPTDKRIISVGDYVSYNLIIAGIKPQIIVFDGKIKRRKVPKKIFKVLKKYGEKEYKVKNPPNHITPELQKAVIESLKQKVSVRIFIEGEEDLAVLPFILKVKEGDIIVYGFPFGKKGIVVLEVNRYWKEKGKNLLKKLREVYQQKIK